MGKILVVDDEKDITDLLSEYLELEGYEVLKANDAEEAEKILSSQEISLMLTDIRMPKKSGIELLKEAKRKYCDLEVVMISALRDINMAIEAMKAGAFSYLLKPFNLSDVSMNVKNALEKRRLILENRRYQLHLEKLVEERTEKLKETIEALEHSYLETLKVLVTTLAVRDIETEGHSERVVEYAALIAKRMGIKDKEFLDDLKKGALLHDIGKMGIPDSILQKKGKFTNEERRIMKLHVLFGYKILSSVDFLKGASQIVLFHHERWDGKGYLSGKKGEDIPLGARIFAVADAFDAMTYSRRYRKALSINEAVKEIKDQKGKQFDPKVVEVFLSIPSDEVIRIREKVEEKVGKTKDIRKILEGIF